MLGRVQDGSRLYLFVAITTAAVACRSEVQDSGDTGFSGFDASQQAELLSFTVEPPPADSTNAYAEDEAAAHLGRFVFFDTRMSGTGEFACATCHDPEQGFADGRALAEATGTTSRHAPTTLNTAYNDWFFWDGRADSHWAQALGPIEDGDEQNFTRLEVAHLFYSDADLNTAYTAVFGAVPDLSDAERFPEFGRPDFDEPSSEGAQNWAGMNADDQEAVNRVFSNVGKAIAAYERKLIRVESPFDALVEAVSQGDATGGDHLDASARRGLDLFMGPASCNLCHFGPMFTNGAFHNIGLGVRDHLESGDLGRYEGIDLVRASVFNGSSRFSDDTETGAHKLDYLSQGTEHIGAFKAPSLRNVAETAPYMHGGHFEALEDVVRYYSELDETPPLGHREETLLPLDLSDGDVADLVAFLQALTGSPLDEGLLVPPAQPSMDARRVSLFP